MWLPGREKEDVGRGEVESWANGDRSGGSPAPSTYLFSPGQIYNLGTGTGYSVLQMVQAMEKASGRKVDLPCPVPPDSQQ